MPPRRKFCVKGLHRMRGRNVQVEVHRGRYLSRRCRACRNDRVRRTQGPLTPGQLWALQSRADGLSAEEAAEEWGSSRRDIHKKLERTRQRLGVESDAAAVALGLKAKLITPDTSGPLPPRSDETAPWVASVLDLVHGRRKPYPWRSGELNRLLDVLYAWDEAHAVSVLWAAGLIKARDVAPLFAKEKRQ